VWIDLPVHGDFSRPFSRILDGGIVGKAFITATPFGGSSSGDWSKVVEGPVESILIKCREHNQHEIPP
jgi:hypothetical protein